MTHYVKIVHGTDAGKFRQVNHIPIIRQLKSRIEPPPRSLGKKRNVSLVRAAVQDVHIIAVNDEYILSRDRPS